MSFWDDCYIDGFVIGYCVSNLVCFSRIYFSEHRDLLERLDMKKLYPDVTEDILKEAFELEKDGEDAGNDTYREFFYKYEDLFKNSEIYEEAVLDAKKSLNEKKYRERIEEVISTLSRASDTAINDEDSNMCMCILFDFKDERNEYKNLTIKKRQILATEFLKIKEKTLDEIKDIILGEYEGYMDFRYKNAVISFKDIKHFYIFQIINFSNKNPWYVCFNHGTGREELRKVNVDENNQVVFSE